MTADPRTIDLFCGAGGLSEGFRQAGYRVLAGLDFDAEAVATARANHPETNILCRDVREVSSTELLEAARIDEVDLILGGPSCQGFSTQGRRGRWASDDDPRNLLYREFARIVGDLRPAWFMMENVPGLLYWNRGEFGRRVFAAFAEHGYQVWDKLALAADYGVPQLRKRLLIVGTRTGLPFEFPAQTHMGAYRRDAIELWDRRRREDYPHLSPHVSLWDAISDLPLLGSSEGAETARYGGSAASDYQRQMRQGCGWLYDHQAPVLGQAHLELINHVREGQTWREIPEELLPPRFAKIRRTDGTNLFARPDRHRPSYTLITQFNNVTTGAYTHPVENRAFSVREGARIQSFPDRYRFYGSLTSKYRQVGNAVPPLLARVMAKAMKAAMAGEVQPTEPVLPLAGM